MTKPSLFVAGECAAWNRQRALVIRSLVRETRKEGQPQLAADGPGMIG
jgi:hypothetical protein